MSFQEYQLIFNNLNEEFKYLKEKINTLMNKYSDLERKIEKKPLQQNLNAASVMTLLRAL